MLTIAATNVPWHIDKAVISRFGARLIYVPLPDENARRAILTILIEQKGHRSEMPLPELVRRLEGYSGREIQAVVEHAGSTMVQRVNPGLLGQVGGGKDALARFTLRVKPILASEFETALVAITPITGESDIARYEAWRQQVDS